MLHAGLGKKKKEDHGDESKEEKKQRKEEEKEEKHEAKKEKNAERKQKLKKGAKKGAKLAKKNAKYLQLILLEPYRIEPCETQQIAHEAFHPETVPRDHLEKASGFARRRIIGQRFDVAANGCQRCSQFV
jgi:hypothetical protein